MKFQTYKYFQKEWMPISFENIHKGDFIRYKDIDTEEFCPNSNGTFTSMVIKNAYFNNKEKSWNVDSKPVTEICYNKNDKNWTAKMTYGKKEELGIFEIIKDAVKVINEAEIQRFGEYYPSIIKDEETAK